MYNTRSRTRSTQPSRETSHQGTPRVEEVPLKPEGYQVEATDLAEEETPMTNPPRAGQPRPPPINIPSLNPPSSDDSDKELYTAALEPRVAFTEMFENDSISQAPRAAQPHDQGYPDDAPQGSRAARASEHAELSAAMRAFTSTISRQSDSSEVASERNI